MKVLYTADLHGNLLFYRRLLLLAVKKKADVVVIGGDLLPKSGDARQLIKEQRGFITGELRALFGSFREMNPGINIYAMMGNDDFSANMDVLEELEEEGLLRLLHMTVHPLRQGLFIAGYGCVRPTPFSFKDWERYDDEPKIIQPGGYRPVLSSLEGVVDINQQEWFASHPTITEDLEQLAVMSDPARTIYVFHDPPYETKLDMLYSREHIGSMAVRRFIERYQPPLVMSGHIHESPRVSGNIKDRIGTTLCINPGQTEAVLQAVLVEVPGWKVKLV